MIYRRLEYYLKKAEQAVDRASSPLNISTGKEDGLLDCLDCACTEVDEGEPVYVLRKLKEAQGLAPSVIGEIPEEVVNYSVARAYYNNCAIHLDEADVHFRSEDTHDALLARSHIENAEKFADLTPSWFHSFWLRLKIGSAKRKLTKRADELRKVGYDIEM